MPHLTMEQTAVACLVLHVIADSTLQTLGKPSLADMKQKAWWNDLLDRGVATAEYGSATAKSAARASLGRKYGDDYKVALWCHSIMWSAITFLPLCTGTGWSLIVAVNAAVHYLVDDLKANRLKINLISDQVLHLAQIWLTFGGYWMTLGIIELMKGAQ